MRVSEGRSLPLLALWLSPTAGPHGVIDSPNDWLGHALWWTIKQPCIHVAEKPEDHQRSKHIDIAYHRVKPFGRAQFDKVVALIQKTLMDHYIKRKDNISKTIPSPHGVSSVMAAWEAQTTTTVCDGVHVDEGGKGFRFDSASSEARNKCVGLRLHVDKMELTLDNYRQGGICHFKFQLAHSDLSQGDINEFFSIGQQAQHIMVVPHSSLGPSRTSRAAESLTSKADSELVGVPGPSRTPMAVESDIEYGEASKRVRTLRHGN
ncbi:hypothetical protein BJ508DRAFT_338846 [Ascobolus immersus RN42]|uniref:Uncharacterized protein n=1 Tax=Ascobolus immersus RN42 TaxID=1160509 RepID=A0A3N4IL40_ASCIM|nr:hypothetical protein BJ508DRAFT_338846 [Ascobolus immersus RN42]